jgi:hypothetical protein
MGKCTESKVLMPFYDPYYETAADTYVLYNASPSQPYFFYA